MLANRIRPAGRYRVALTVTRRRGTHRLTIATRFVRLAAGSSALVTWEVMAGKRLVAKRTVSLTGNGLHRGLVSRAMSAAVRM